MNLEIVNRGVGFIVVTQLCESKILRLVWDYHLCKEPLCRCGRLLTELCEEVRVSDTVYRGLKLEVGCVRAIHAVPK